MMRKIKLFPTILLSLYILGGCSQVKIIADYDKDSDFPNLKTYMFLPWREINSEMVDDFNKEIFYSAIENELDARGYKKVSSNAEMAVNILVIVEKGTAYSAYRGYYNYGGYGYYYPFGMGYSTVRYQAYENLTGTLVIDIFDHKGKKLIWQGVAVGEVKEKSNNRKKKIEKVVSRIFWKYPVQKKK